MSPRERQAADSGAGVAGAESVGTAGSGAGAAGDESVGTAGSVSGAVGAESVGTAGSEPDLGGDDQPVDLAEVVAERDAYLGDLQRVTAEFANFRRQTERRNAETVARAASRLAGALLPVLDACAAAASQGVEGIDAVHAQLLGVLSGEGLTVLGAVDEPFDPGRHEAVMAEESNDDDGAAAPVVAEVLRTGYAWKGRVLRAAMVKVRG